MELGFRQFSLLIELHDHVSQPRILLFQVGFGLILVSQLVLELLHNLLFAGPLVAHVNSLFLHATLFVNKNGLLVPLFGEFFLRLLHTIKEEPCVLDDFLEVAVQVFYLALDVLLLLRRELLLLAKSIGHKFADGFIGSQVTCITSDDFVDEDEVFILGSDLILFTEGRVTFLLERDRA